MAGFARVETDVTSEAANLNTIDVGMSVYPPE